MRRNEYTHRRRHISNRHLSDKYYYAGEHETATGIRLTQYNEQSLHTKEVRITDLFQQTIRLGSDQLVRG